MRNPEARLSWLVLCTLLAACKADIPEGVFSCTENRDCPSGFECRPPSEGDSQEYCFARGTETGPEAGRDGGLGGEGAGSGGSAGAGSGGSGSGGSAGAGSGGSGSGGVEPVAPSSTRFSTLGEPRRGDGVALYHDGFEYGERLCTTDGTLCVTGGFEP